MQHNAGTGMPPPDSVGGIVFFLFLPLAWVQPLLEYRCRLLVLQNILVPDYHMASTVSKVLVHLLKKSFTFCLCVICRILPRSVE
jgi:hypothetical protein